MKEIFRLQYKDDLTVSPTEIMEKNVHALETLCRRAHKEGFKVVLISPEKYERPKSVYELSAMLAEDLLMKFNNLNGIIQGEIVRDDF